MATYRYVRANDLKPGDEIVIDGEIIRVTKTKIVHGSFFEVLGIEFLLTGVFSSEGVEVSNRLRTEDFVVMLNPRLMPEDEITSAKRSKAKEDALTAVRELSTLSRAAGTMDADAKRCKAGSPVQKRLQAGADKLRDQGNELVNLVKNILLSL